MPGRPPHPSALRTERTRHPVAPGAVAWHADLEEATRAAAVSGKPVLLFELLGQLDDAFC